MNWVKMGSAAMFAAVCLGAFGGHVLKRKLSPEMFDIFEVGIRYHVYHALALFVVAWLAQTTQSVWATRGGWAFAAGIVLFSGSLYLLSLTGVRALGMITPLGGLLFLVGWAFLALA
jgi:uncharacterized membrane protein YgdD (TMEM256/DUF423 family)